MFEIRRSDIEAVFDAMGPVDVGVQCYCPNPYRSSEKYFGIRISQGLQSHFWLSVATWYCEFEFTNMCNLPKWVPLDLAYAAVQISPDHVYFEDFTLVEDL